MQTVRSVVSRVAQTDATIMISGYDGTGKGLVARLLHANSRRSAQPFMRINCAAFPEALLESELFGHEAQQRPGLLESASGGTIFLEEISETSTELQGKLLRVLQDRMLRRVGGETEVPIDVRWIFASVLDPEHVIRDGRLREDFLSRIDAVSLTLPPLRKRREDIPLLAEHFLRQYAREYDRGDLRFSPEAIGVLLEYDWGGNVPELQMVLERAVSLSSPGQQITPAELPGGLQWRTGARM